MAGGGKILFSARFLGAGLIVAVSLYLIPWPHQLGAGQQEGSEEKILTLFQAANRLYTQKQYRTALNTFRMVLEEIDRSPDKARHEESALQTLLIIAHCHFELGERDQAKLAFIGYLKRKQNLDEDPDFVSEKIGVVYGEAKAEYRMMLAAKAQEEAKAAQTEPAIVAKVPVKEEAKPEKALETEAKKPEAKPKEEPAATIPQKPVVKAKASEAEAGRKKGRFPWLLLGGLAVGGAAAAVLLLGKKSTPDGPTTGSIQISSTPSGAKAYLDGTEKGTTPMTISNVAVGSHAVKLTKEGYKDHQESVNVEGGKTATVNIALSKHTISVTKPTANELWTKGADVAIAWTTDTSATLGQFFPMNPAGRIGLASPTRWNFVAGPASAWRGDDNRMTGPTDQGVRRGAGQELPGSIGEGRGSVGTLRDYGPGAMRSPRLDGLSRLKGANVGQPGSAGGPGKIRALVVTNVKIELYKGGSQVMTISSSTANSGSYSWTAPESLASGNNYKVRVSCVEETSVFGESVAFAIGEKYVFVIAWGSNGSGNGQFGSPNGVAVDKSGHIYVADTSNYRIQKFSSSGGFITKWGSNGSGNGQLNQPMGVAVDNLGYIYVADTYNHRIQKFSSNGGFIKKWGNIGDGNGQFYYPSGVAVDRSGHVYVSDTWNDRIQKFGSSGGFIKKWGGYGSGNGQFNFPMGVTVDNSGYVYVADNLYNNRIQKFSSSGGFIKKWGSEGSGNGQFFSPAGVAVDNSGYVYVADQGNHRIQKFSSSGGFITKWGDWGSGNGQFFSPMGIAVDSSGNVYVADSGNHRIQKFRLSHQKEHLSGDTIPIMPNFNSTQRLLRIRSKRERPVDRIDVNEKKRGKG